MKLLFKILITVVIAGYVFFPYYASIAINFALKDHGVKITTLHISYPSFKRVFIPRVSLSYKDKELSADNISIDYLWKKLQVTHLTIAVDKINFIDIENTATSPNFAQLCWLPKQIKKININKVVVNDLVVNDIFLVKDKNKINFSGDINQPMTVSLLGSCNQNKFSDDVSLIQDDLIIKKNANFIAHKDNLNIEALLLANEIEIKIKASHHFSDKKTNVRISMDSVELPKLKSLLNVYTDRLDKLNFSNGMLNGNIVFSVSDKLLKNSQHLQSKDIPNIDYNFEIKGAVGGYDKYKFNNTSLIVKGVYDDGLLASGHLKIDSINESIRLNDIHAKFDIKQQNEEIQIKLLNVGVKLLGGSAHMDKIFIKYPPIYIDSQLVLQDIELEQTVQAFDFENIIKMDGIVSGIFNVEYSNIKGINVDGQLSNQGEGNIRYQNDIDFLAFLKNLHYKKIKIMTHFKSNVLRLKITNLQANDNSKVHKLYEININNPVVIKIPFSFISE